MLHYDICMSCCAMHSASCDGGLSHSFLSDSMQGAFILVGNNSFGYPLLVVMAVGVFTYAAWRFWEGITGQGSDDAFGPFKNFFRYRLSPLVSVSAISHKPYVTPSLCIQSCCKQGTAQLPCNDCGTIAVFMNTFGCSTDVVHAQCWWPLFAMHAFLRL